MLRFFRKSSTKGASIILATATFLSYFLGILRDKSLAYFFGASIFTDAYNASFLLPDMIFNLLIAGTFTGVLIPTIIEYRSRSEAEAEELINVFLTVMGVVIIFISLLALLFTPQLIPFVVDTRTASPEMLELTISLTRIMLLSPLLFGLSNTLGAILMATHHFTSYALSPALYNIGILMGIWFLSPFIGIYGATIGTILGMIFHLLIRFLDLKSAKLSFRAIWTPTHPGFLHIIKKSIPRTLGLLTIMYVLILFSFVGSGLGEGAYSANIFARNVQSFLINMFGVAIATAILPRLSEYIVEKKHHLFGGLLQKSASQLLYVTLPAVPLFLFLGQPIVTVLLGGGAFDPNAIALTAGLLFFYALSIPSECLIHVYARAFYATQKLLFPTISFFLFGIVVTAVLWSTKGSIGVLALPLSWICGMFVQQVFLMGSFHLMETHLSFPGTAFFVTCIKIIFIAVTCGAGLFLLTSWGLSTLPELVLGGLLWLSLYLLMSFLFRMDEFLFLKEMLYKKIIRS